MKAVKRIRLKNYIKIRLKNYIKRFVYINELNKYRSEIFHYIICYFI